MLITYKDIAPEVNADKTESHVYVAAECRTKSKDNKSFKTAVKFKHFSLTLINQNYNHEKINSTLNWLIFATNHSHLVLKNHKY